MQCVNLVLSLFEFKLFTTYSNLNVATVTIMNHHPIYNYYKFQRTINGAIGITVIRSQSLLREFSYSCESKYSPDDASDLSLVRFNPVILDPTATSIWHIGRKYVLAHPDTISGKQFEYETLTGGRLQVHGQLSMVEVTNDSELISMCTNVDSAIATQQTLAVAIGETKLHLANLMAKYEEASEAVELAKLTLKKFT